jgi:uncharacterized membrane protein YphA (DoxX/SURF4 family)
LDGTMSVTRPGPNGIAPIPKEVKVAQEIQDYKDRLKESKEAANPTDREEARADADRLRAELQKAVDEQTAELKAVLEGWRVNEDKQAAARPVTGYGAAALVAAAAALSGSITAEQRAEYGPLPEPVVRRMSDWDRLDWVDFATRWGLVVIGGLLLAGLLTRTACVAGALFLLSLYVAMPPFPWLPPNPRAEGHYLYINKNLIEMLALLALATTRSGRWLGLDALFPALRRRPQAPAQPTLNEVTPGAARPAGPNPPVRETPVAVAPAPGSPYTPKEPMHGH